VCQFPRPFNNRVVSSLLLEEPPLFRRPSSPMSEVLTDGLGKNDAMREMLRARNLSAAHDSARRRHSPGEAW
jgi:hypothetical protein